MLNERMQFEETLGYFPCGINGCILEEHHCGVCVMPDLPRRQRSTTSTEGQQAKERSRAREPEATPMDISKPSSPLEGTYRKTTSRPTDRATVPR